MADSSTDNAGGGTGPVRRAAELTRFREMIHRQTDELNSAIQQRSDYERRLETAERLATKLQQENEVLLEQQQQQQHRGLTPPPSPDHDELKRLKGLFDIMSSEMHRRLEIVHNETSERIGSLLTTFVAVTSEGRAERAIAEERSKTSALTFQLRVATPMRIRGLMAKLAVAEKREATVQKSLNEANQEIELLLLDSGELRDKKSELEDHVYRLQSELDNASRIQDRLEDSHGANEELMRQIESHTYEVETLHAENETLRKELAAAAKELTALVQRESDAVQSVSNILKEGEEQHSSLRADHAREVHYLEDEIANVRNEIHKLQKDLRASQDHLASVQQHDAAATAELVLLKEIVEQMSHEKRSLERDNELFRNDLESAAAEVRGLVRRESDVSRLYKEGEEQGNALRDSHARDLHHLEDQLSSMRSAQKRLETDKRTLATREQGLNAELESLQELVARLKQEKEDAVQALREEKVKSERELHRLQETIEQQSASTLGELRGLRMAVTSADVNANSLRYQTETLRQQLEAALQQAADAKSSFAAEKKAMDEKHAHTVKDHASALTKIQTQSVEALRMRDRHWEQIMAAFAEEAEDRFRVLVGGRQELLDAVFRNEITVMQGAKQNTDLLKDSEHSHRNEIATLEAQHAAEMDRATSAIADRERSLKTLRETLDEKETLILRKDAVMDDIHQQASHLETQLREERVKRRELAAQCGEQEVLVSSLEKMLSAAQSRATKSEAILITLEEKVQSISQVSRESGKAAEERHQSELQSLIDSELALRRQRTQLQTDLQRTSNEVDRLAAVEEALRQHAASNQSVMEQQHAEIVKLRDEIDTLQQARRLLEREKVTIQAELDDIRETGNSYKDVLGNATTARATLTEELLHLQEKFASQTIQLHSVERELDTAKTQLGRTAAANDAHVQQLEVIQSQCKELTASFDEVCSRLRDSNAENATLREIMEESIEAVETEVRALHVETSALKHENDVLRRTVDSKEAEIQRLGGFVSSLQSDSVVCESHWKDRYHAMENQCAALRSQVTTLEDQIATLVVEQTREHRLWKDQLSTQKDTLEKEVSAAHSAVETLKQSQLSLLQTIRERDDSIVALQVEQSRLSNDIKLLEYASVEALEEHRTHAEAANENSLEYWGKLESSAEQVARFAVLLEKATGERDKLQVQFSQLREEHLADKTLAQEKMDALITRHQNDTLTMETMMESLVAQERQQRLAASQQLTEAEGKWHKTLQHGEVESLRADAAESSLQRIKEQLLKAQSEREQEIAAHQLAMSNISAELRGAEHQLGLLRAANGKLEDALELEKSSSVAEEHALREEIERREKQYEKKLADLSEEWRSELQRRGVTATHVSKTHTGEVENLQNTVQELERALQLARQQHTELFQRFSTSQQSIDDVTHLLGAARLECERLERAVAVKDENLDAALTQASEAAAAAAKAVDELSIAETQAMELRRALLSAQRDLDVARRSEESTSKSVGSLEATIESRWQHKLDVQRDQWLHVVHYQRDAAVSILEQLETDARSTLEFLFQDIALVSVAGRTCQSLQNSIDRWVALESRLVVELDAATKKISTLSRQGSASSASLHLQLQESDARLQLLLHANDSTAQSEFVNRFSRAFAEYQRDLRIQQTRTSTQELSMKKLRSEVEEYRSALQIAKLELDESKRNCDSFSKISEDMAAEASEWKLKYNAEATAASHATSSCASALDFTSRHVVEEEVEWRYRFQSVALDLLADVTHRFTAMFSDACRENVGLNRLKDRAEIALRAEVDTLHATWRDRLEDSHRRCHDAERRCEAMALLHSEALSRVAMHQAMHMWVAQEFLPLAHRQKLSIFTVAHQREVRELRHALYVGHKESLLIKQRAQSLVDMEVASCKQILDRLHRRRVDDLRWLPHSAVVPPPQHNGSLKEPTPGFLVAQYLIEDLETESRATMSRMTLDALHALHMCLLIT